MNIDKYKLCKTLIPSIVKKQNNATLKTDMKKHGNNVFWLHFGGARGSYKVTNLVLTSCG